MKFGQQRLEQEVDAVIEQERQIRPTPDLVRARLLARARAAKAASLALSTPIPVITSGGRGRLLAFVAGALVAFGTAGAAAAVYSHVIRAREIRPSPPRVPEVPMAPAPGLPAAERPEVVPTARPPRRLRVITPRESYAAELQLLQRAQTEYSSHDFGSALVLLAEHRRRFRNGRLAEEREALCVGSLARAGRDDEMRAALAAFTRRFPRSLLLPWLQEASRFRRVVE